MTSRGGKAPIITPVSKTLANTPLAKEKSPIVNSPNQIPENYITLFADPRDTPAVMSVYLEIGSEIDRSALQLHIRGLRRLNFPRETDAGKQDDWPGEVF